MIPQAGTTRAMPGIKKQTILPAIQNACGREENKKALIQNCM